MIEPEEYETDSLRIVVWLGTLAEFVTESKQTSLRPKLSRADATDNAGPDRPGERDAS